MSIQHQELTALKGLPYMQQLLYLCGIKPYVDYRTGLVGVKRGISYQSFSYQSFSEVLYIEPHSGIQSGSPSKSQLRRALKSLKRSGLIKIQYDEYTLILRCLFVSIDNSVQNKAFINPSRETVRFATTENLLKSKDNGDLETKTVTVINSQPAIPQSNNNYFVFLYQKFEKFWEIYHLKKSRQKAWEQFQAIQPTEKLCSHMLTALEQQILAYHQQQAKTQWAPGWKFPGNWLAQQCWEDHITDTIQEKSHAKYQTLAPKQPVDPFWESCKRGAEPDPEPESEPELETDTETESNIVEFSGYQKTPNTH